MKGIRLTAQFKWDIKRLQEGKNLEKLKTVLASLVNERILPSQS